MLGERFILVKDLRPLVGVEPFEQLEKTLRIEAFHAVIRSVATLFSDGHDSQPWLDRFEPPDQLAAGDISYAHIQHRTIHAGEL